ncbi:hypothetical protein MNEG_16223, partial [Monoraphidium neglectum]
MTHSASMPASHMGLAAAAGSIAPPPAPGAPSAGGRVGPAHARSTSMGMVSVAGSEASGAGGSGGVGGSGGPELLRMLALYADLGLEYTMTGPDSSILAELRGLAIKAQERTLEDDRPTTTASITTPIHSADPAAIPSPTEAAAIADPAAAAAAAAELPQPAAGPGSEAAAVAVARGQQVAISILEPCDVTARYRVSETLQDVKLDISDVQLRMSPDVMALIMHQLEAVYAPLVVPPPDQPLARCHTFELVWSSRGLGGGGGAAPPFATAGAGGVDTMSSEKGVSIWRPQAPTGYAIAGDIVTPGVAHPNHQVVAIAINSGFVRYPVSYQLVWEAPGVSVWRPVPPPGYVALGCVAAPGAAPPPLKAAVVAHRLAVVEAPLGECALLCANGNLWSVANS